MKTLKKILPIKIISILLVLVSISSCEEEECGYDVVLDCPNLELNIGNACDSDGDGALDGIVNDTCECIMNPPPFDCIDLGLNIGDQCDSNGDDALDGTVNDVCECIMNPPPFDCIDLELNIGDECDSKGDGMLDGVVNDVCECIDNTFPFSCSEGMDVAFLIDYTGSMGGAIDGIKTNVAAIASNINFLSLGNYQLSLSIFDEQFQDLDPLYFTETEYTSLPTSQRLIISTGTSTRQFLTVMEPFSFANEAVFSTQLAKLNGPMSLGNGVGFPEPGGLLLNEILEPNTFAGNWRTTNITKLVIIITDATAGGDDDTADATDDTYLAALAAMANPGGGSSSGTQVILVSSLATSNYEIHLVDNNTGGLKLMNADFNNIADDINNLLEEVCMNNEM